METFELIVEKKKAAKLISFLKQLDFVEIKEIKRKKRSAKKNIDDIIIAAANPQADISTLFGAWKNTNINSSDIRIASRKTGKLQW